MSNSLGIAANSLPDFGVARRPARHPLCNSSNSNRRVREVKPRVAEFFAGIGLVRLALEKHGFEIVWANDIEPAKQNLYVKNFGASDFVLGDVRDVRGEDLPDIELATASFPCTDLSLAGNRAGLNGSQSGMFWEFARVLEEMGERRSSAVMLENVPSLATSHQGQDLQAIIQELNRLGYYCDLLTVDARHFVPQSRPRLFIVGSREPAPESGSWRTSAVRAAWVGNFVRDHPELQMNAFPLELPENTDHTLADIVERFPSYHELWWDAIRQDKFIRELSPLHYDRLFAMRNSQRLSWATAYRRTRNGKPTWEIRPDAISGCLRTARGGSSKQAIVEAGGGRMRVRWMSAIEYARLQGAPGYKFDGVSQNSALFGFGDAVCVPVVSWIGKARLLPIFSRRTLQSAQQEKELMYA